MLKSIILSSICVVALQAAPKSIPQTVKKLPGIELKLDSLLMKDTYKSSLLNAETQEIKIDAKSWKTWKVTKALPHGTFVKKGDVILTFDREDYDKELAKRIRAFELAELTYKQSVYSAEVSLKKLAQQKAYSTLDFQKYKISLELYNKVGKVLKRKAQETALADAKLRLQFTESELRELEAMYKSDEIYEKTEEMVIKRQRNAVSKTKDYVKNAEYKYELAQRVTNPKIDLKDKHKKENFALDQKAALMSFDTREKVQASGLLKLKESFEKKKKSFEEFKKDGEFFSIKAEQNGQVINGSLNRGKWSNIFGKEIKEKTLIKKGSSPMLLITGPTMKVTVLIPYAKAKTLQDSPSFVVSPVGGVAREARLVSTTATPVNGMLEAEFQVDDSKGLYQGIPVSLQVIRKKSDLLFVSSKSIKRDDLKPWETYVNVSKEGKTVKVPVTTGESYSGKTIITSGLKVSDRVL